MATMRWEVGKNRCWFCAQMLKATPGFGWSWVKGFLVPVCYRDIQILGGIRYPERDEIYEIDPYRKKISKNEKLAADLKAALERIAELQARLDGKVKETASHI